MKLKLKAKTRDGSQCLYKAVLYNHEAFPHEDPCN